MIKFLKFGIPVIAIVAFTILAAVYNTSFGASDYLSFGLTLLTYFYVIFTWEMLQRMKSESYLERRPYVIADFESPKSNMWFFFENIGKSPAINLKINVSPDFQLLKEEDTINSTILKDKIEFFPPGKRVETYLAPSHEFFKHNSEKFNISLEYQDSFNKTFHESIILDLNHHKKQSYIRETQLKDLVKALEALNRTLNKK